LGMVGPIANLVCHVDDHAKWSNVYSNDYLKSKSSVSQYGIKFSGLERVGG